MFIIVSVWLWRRQLNENILLSAQTDNNIIWFICIYLSSFVLREHAEMLSVRWTNAEIIRRRKNEHTHTHTNRSWKNHSILDFSRFSMHFARFSIILAILFLAAHSQWPEVCHFRDFFPSVFHSFAFTFGYYFFDCHIWVVSIRIVCNFCNALLNFSYFLSLASSLSLSHSFIWTYQMTFVLAFHVLEANAVFDFSTFKPKRQMNGKFKGNNKNRVLMLTRKKKPEIICFRAIENT